MSDLNQLIYNSSNPKLAFAQLLNRAKNESVNKNSTNEIYARMASIIEIEFNNMFFSDATFRETNFSNEEVDRVVEEKSSPFKFYICKLFKDLTRKEVALKEEIDALIKNKVKIAGVITTNYDLLVENIFPHFSVYKDQFELLNSRSFCFSELYKIHGCCTKPESIVFTKEDYDVIDRTNMYLAAKLLTIFVEFPVIFIGYSLSDEDIRKIFRDISKCLTNTHRKKLKHQIIFLGIPTAENPNEGIYSRNEEFDGQHIEFVEIILKDFSIFYNALDKVKSKYRVDLARALFNEVSQIVISNKANCTVYASALENPNVKGSELACYIGTNESIGSIDKGLVGLKIDELYCDIIFDHLGIINNEFLLNKVFLDLRSNSPRSYFPIYKYGFDAKTCLDFLDKNSFFYIKNDVFEVLTESQKKLLRENSQLTQFANIYEIEKANEKSKNPVLANIKYISYSIKNLKIEDVIAYIVGILGHASAESISCTKAATDIRKLICMCDFIKYKIEK